MYCVNRTDFCHNPRRLFRDCLIFLIGKHAVNLFLRENNREVVSSNYAQENEFLHLVERMPIYIQYHSQHRAYSHFVQEF